MRSCSTEYNILDMRIIKVNACHSIAEQPLCERAQTATIGFFDGLHKGHRKLIGDVVQAALRNGTESMVVTLDRHPSVLFCPERQPRLITTAEERIELLAETGVDNCAIVEFNSLTASLSARDFMRRILKTQLNVSTLIIGFDSRFGHNRTEGFEEYRAYGREMDLDVIQDVALTNDGDVISSSSIRTMVGEGNMERAASFLGRPFSIRGVVVGGFQQGRKMGFPTANIRVLEDVLLPATGVYAVWVEIAGYQEVFQGMMDIGMRPTFNRCSMSVEVHILDFNADIYGKDVKLSFVSRIRREKKFDSVSELVNQLTEDEIMTRQILSEELAPKREK